MSNIIIVLVFVFKLRYCQQEAGHRGPAVLIKSSQHWLLEETQSLGPPHSDRAMMVSPAVPTTPTTPRGASSRGRMEAVAAGPPRAVAVVASRAKPPGRERRVTIINFIEKYSELSK